MKFFIQLVTVLVITAFSANAIAQDVILKRDDTKVEAKIIEVHDDEIHYKKFSNIEGPTYVIETSKIKSITYQNGDIEEYVQVQEKETPKPTATWQKSVEPNYSEEIETYNGKYYYHNRRIGTARTKTLIYTQGDPEAIRMWKTSKTVQGVGYAIGFATIPIGLIAMIGTTSFDPDIVLIVGGGGFILGNITMTVNHIMKSMYKNQRKQAVVLYNEALKQEVHEDDDYY
ncbi:MAG: hypothetical protein JKY53_06615 [Flavobacteriales bacterium]|nr:hypothetical protein [Flavobacteriales bacterium]